MSLQIWQVKRLKQQYDTNVDFELVYQNREKISNIKMHKKRSEADQFFFTSIILEFRFTSCERIFAGNTLYYYK